VISTTSMPAALRCRDSPALQHPVPSIPTAASGPKLDNHSDNWRYPAAVVAKLSSPAPGPSSSTAAAT
jgi:hypothetical protein